MVLAEARRGVARAELRNALQPALHLVTRQPRRNRSARDDLPRLIDDVALAQVHDVLAQDICTHAEFVDVRQELGVLAREPSVERDQPFLFHRERTVARREAIRLCAQIVLLTAQSGDLLLGLREFRIRLLLCILRRGECRRRRIECRTRICDHGVQPVHAKERRPHILRCRREDAEGHRRDADARKDRDDHRRMARAQPKEREFFLSDARAEAVADDGDDAADDSEHENQRNTVHDVTSFMRQTRAAANLSAMRAAGG